MPVINATAKVILLVSLLLSVSCATTSSNEKDNKTGLFGDEEREVVVQRIGQRNTIVSPYGKNHWYEARQSKNTSIKRIQGMLATGESLNAERAARNYLEKNPGHPEALMALSAALAHSGQYDLAGYYARLVAKKIPNNSRSQNIEALSILMKAKNMSDYRRAEQLFQSAFDGNSNEIAAGLNLASMYLEVGNAGNAATIFEQASNRCDRCAAAELGLGIAKMRLNQFKSAVGHLERASKNPIEKSKALYYLALTYKNGLNAPKKAEESLRTLLAEGSSKDGATLRLGHTLLRKIKAERSKKESMIAARKAAKENKSKKNNEPVKQDRDLSTSDLDDDFSTAPTLTGGK